ncbi:metallophosphoesterase family protein [Sphingomonas sp.]|uniref:metallophosphoesterase family protein n=1 Tax=Sphingomonas sp. TaxID=28214 RepID=UPI00286EAF5E|nr:metallophosphoesterase family protein [Sphingomonas sp.]
MFGLLQKRSTARAPRRGEWQVPAGVRVYAVGDVHGCLVELERLLDQIEADAGAIDATVHVVFLGDLIDRGPDSAGVIRRLLDGPLPGHRRSFLMGNHEEAMLRAWDGDGETLRGWLAYGGLETLASYGLDRGDVFRLAGELPRAMREVIPPAHIDFMRGFEDQVRVGNYLFVHAGIRPGVALADQERADLRWIREEFLYDDESDHGVMVVHGHTIVAEPEVRSNRIGIDTGCYSSGRLTALVLEGGDRRFLGTS